MSILNLYNNLNTFLIIGALLFGMGVYGIVSRRTLIGMLISAELLLAGASINFMAFTRFTAADPITGQVFTFRDTGGRPSWAGGNGKGNGNH